MNVRTLCVTAVLMFVLSGVARAAELSTTAMTPGSDLLWCNIVNISTVAQTVRIRIYNSGGAVTYDSGNVVIGPRVTLWGTSAGAGTEHCRFTTVNGKALFRASVSVYQGATVRASVPAQ